MLTPRQNFLETIKGGNPDRFVKQYEFFNAFPDPCMTMGYPSAEGDTVVNEWGVTISWPVGIVTPYPIHDERHKVVGDITRWRDFVKIPEVDFPDDVWESAVEAAEAVDKTQQFLAAGLFPGFFEFLHYLMGMNDCLYNMAAYPDQIHELVDVYLDFLMRRSDAIVKHVKPDMLMFSDDLGTSTSSFMSPEMFQEFFLPAYQQLFAKWRSNGVELIYHHNDSYSANLVPYIIEAGADVWQGCLTSNDVPALVQEYGGRLSFMGDIDSSVVDSPDWTRELIEGEVRRACETNGKLYFIPCMTMGGAPALYDGVFEYIDECIDRMSEEMF